MESVSLQASCLVSFYSMESVPETNPIDAITLHSPESTETFEVKIPHKHIQEQSLSFTVFSSPTNGTVCRSLEMTIEKIRSLTLTGTKRAPDGASIGIDLQIPADLSPGKNYDIVFLSNWFGMSVHLIPTPAFSPMPTDRDSTARLMTCFNNLYRTLDVEAGNCARLTSQAKNEDVPRLHALARKVHHDSRVFEFVTAEIAKRNEPGIDPRVVTMDEGLRAMNLGRT